MLELYYHTLHRPTSVRRDVGAQPSRHARPPGRRYLCEYALSDGVVPREYLRQFYLEVPLSQIHSELNIF